MTYHRFAVSRFGTCVGSIALDGCAHLGEVDDGAVDSISKRMTKARTTSEVPARAANFSLLRMRCYFAFAKETAFASCVEKEPRFCVLTSVASALTSAISALARLLRRSEKMLAKLPRRDGVAGLEGLEGSETASSRRSFEISVVIERSTGIIRESIDPFRAESCNS